MVIQKQKHIKDPGSEPWNIQNPGIRATLFSSELCNSVFFRTLLYTEPWYIQNPVIFRILACSKSDIYSKPWLFRNLGYPEPSYSEPCHIQKRRHIHHPVIESQKHIQNPVTFRTLAYSEPCFILNLVICKTLEYSEPWHN